MLDSEDYLSKIKIFRQRIGMYIGEPTYDRTCSFLIGMDYGLDGPINSEFGDWIRHRYEIVSPFAWPEVMGTLIQERHLNKKMNEIDKINCLLDELNIFLDHFFVLGGDGDIISNL